MPIYTKTGDTGQTSLFGGKRLSKSDPQIDAYGDVDELTSYLGLIIVKLPEKETRAFLTHIQRDLYQIMGILAGADTSLSEVATRIRDFEAAIDTMDKKLPTLNRFILPGGTEKAALFHIVRTICRRAERTVVDVVSLKNWNSQAMHITIQYLNRLSDLLFTYARWYNREQEILT